jgi:hypothetical protein
MRDLNIQLASCSVHLANGCEELVKVERSDVVRCSCVFERSEVVVELFRVSGSIERKDVAVR